jgi:hypothetical protein
MLVNLRLTAVIVMLLGSGIAADSGKQAAHDGVWWRSVDHYRHLGFLEGYMDCYAYVHPGPARFEGVSPYEYEKRIAAYYDTHPNELAGPVSELLLSLAPPSKTITARSTFGVYDGEDWRQGGPSYRPGFIQGYFECLRSEAKRVARFSKPDSYYVEQISKWYGVKDDDPGEIDLKRSPTMIAHVLFMFKDSIPNGATGANPQ